jgi:hypothetical protein
LRPDDWILSVNDSTPNLEGRDFLYWFRMTFDAGAKITYKVVDSHGKPRTVTFTAQVRGR